MTLRKQSALRISQKKIVECLLDHDEYMVTADMGVGKTGAALTAIRMQLDRGKIAHMLVIAPLLVAEETWPEEIEAWEHTRGFTYEVLTGPASRREQRALRLPELTIVNRENLPWLVEFWETRGGWPYDGVGVDEMSSFKSPKKRNKPTKKVVEEATARFLKAMPALPKDLTDEQRDTEIEIYLEKKLKQVKGELTRFGVFCNIRMYIDWIFGLTGTPASNGMEDIWAQYYLLDQGKRLHDSFSKYRSRYFEGDYMGFKYTLRDSAFAQITEKVKDITISMDTADFVDMPPVVYNTVKVKLPAKVMDAYKRFEKKMVLEEHDIEAVNNGVLTGKLLQLANGSVYDEEGATVEIHDMKLEALDRLIEEAQGQPVFVAYSYKFDLEKLRKKYPKAEVVGEGKNVVKRWNEGKIKILLAHPQSAGHGLNLQYGGCITVWYGLCWSLEYYQQLNKRLHRPGQTRTVFIHHIVAEGTVDERVMKVLPDKNATQRALMEVTRWRPPVDSLV